MKEKKKQKQAEKKLVTTQPDELKPKDLLKKLKKFNPINKTQVGLEMLINNKDIIFVTGSPGTGKTFASTWIALNMIKDTTSKFDKLILCKSVVQIKGEEMGFMPGSLIEKLEQVMYSFTGNVDKIFQSKEANNKLMDQGIIEWMPVAYLRGCQFDNAIVIVDEAQNLDAHCLKTIITRLGKSSKLIIMGDLEQYDRGNTKYSGFEKIKNILKDSNYIGNVEFLDKDCVRNPIISDVIKKLRKENI